MSTPHRGISGDQRVQGPKGYAYVPISKSALGPCMPGHHLVCHGIILVLSLCRRQNSLCMQRHRLSNRERLIADPSSPFGFLTGPLPVPLWRRLTILPVHKGSIPVNVQSNTRLVRARDGAVPAAYMLVHAHIASKAPGTILQAPRPEQVSTMDGSAGIFVPFSLHSVSLPLAA
ncbi:hypothetical protein Trisim1_000002 [Trichoderma cf. simile WF8]